MGRGVLFGLELRGKLGVGLGVGLTVVGVLGRVEHVFEVLALCVVALRSTPDLSLDLRAWRW